MYHLDWTSRDRWSAGQDGHCILQIYTAHRCRKLQHRKEKNVEVYHADQLNLQHSQLNPVNWLNRMDLFNQTMWAKKCNLEYRKKSTVYTPSSSIKKTNHENAMKKRSHWKTTAVSTRKNLLFQTIQTKRAIQFVCLFVSPKQNNTTTYCLLSIWSYCNKILKLSSWVWMDYGWILISFKATSE